MENYKIESKFKSENHASKLEKVQYLSGFQRVFLHVRTDLTRKPVYPAMPIRTTRFRKKLGAGNDNLYNKYEGAFSKKSETLKTNGNILETANGTVNLKRCLNMNKETTDKDNKEERTNTRRNASVSLKSMQPIENFHQNTKKISENVQKKGENKSRDKDMLNFIPERTSRGRILKRPRRFMLPDDLNEEKFFKRNRSRKKLADVNLSKVPNSQKDGEVCKTQKKIQAEFNKEAGPKRVPKYVERLEGDCKLENILQKYALRSQKNRITTRESKEPSQELEETLKNDVAEIRPTSEKLLNNAITIEPLKKQESIEEHNPLEVLCIDEEFLVPNDLDEEIENYLPAYANDKVDKTPSKVWNNEEICGAIDIKTFQLNCIICPRKYFLHQWLKFLEHFKLYHQEYFDSKLSANEYYNIIKTALNTEDAKTNEGCYYHSYNAVPGSEIELNTISHLTTLDNSLSLNDVDQLEELNSDAIVIEVLDSEIKNGIIIQKIVPLGDRELPCDLILDNPQESSNTVDYSQKELNKDEDIYIENDFDNSNHKSQPEEDDEAEKDEFNTEISNYSSEDEVGLNELNEDEVPKPTNGCGIILGVTNNLVVMEFLRLLEAYPILYEPGPNCTRMAYDKALTSIRFIINDKFQIGLTDFEMRNTVRRIIDWYYRNLRKLRNESLEQENDYDIESELYEISDQSDCIPEKLKKYFETCSRFLPSYLIDEKTIHNFVVVNPYNVHITYPPWITFSSENNPENPNEEDKSMHQSPENMKSDLNSVQTKMKSIQKLKEFQCDVCGKILTQKATLRTHKFYHGKPSHVCNLCGKAFYRQYWLNSHIKTKHKTKSVPYICEYCGKAFYSHGTFRMHKLTVHMNLRYTCVVCNYETQSRRYLQQHQMKRHQALEGTIEELSKSLKPQGMRLIPRNSEYHDGYLWKMSVRKPGVRMFSCITCQLVFDRYKDILNHNKEFHPIRHRTYMCVLCPPGKTLMRSSLRRHYTTMHKVPASDLENLMCRTKHVQSLDEISAIVSTNNSADMNKTVAGQTTRKRKASRDVKGLEISLSLKEAGDAANESNFGIEDNILNTVDNQKIVTTPLIDIESNIMPKIVETYGVSSQHTEPTFESRDRVEIETDGIIEVGHNEYNNECEEIILDEEYLVSQLIQDDECVMENSGG